MARRLQHLQGDAGAQAHGVAIVHRHEWVFRFRPRTQVNGGARPLAQLQVAGDEIGVGVRQKHMANLKPLLPGVLDITIHVTLGINHGRHPCVLIGDEVRRMRQAV